uniref:Uncharacterized protein n=1 Tax=Moniliophthora roreri TaxID=221103 RepID=A0A0W0FI39_MONRR
MPKFKPEVYKTGQKKGETCPNFLVETTHHNNNGNLVYNSQTGRAEKVQIQMTEAHFENGLPQNLYYTESPNAGLFKSMATILTERGYDPQKISRLKAQCGTNFNCLPGATDCCCCCILFNELDFTSVKSLLEEACIKRSVQVWFLPKFHCELNPIKQCWGYAKRLYC